MHYMPLVIKSISLHNVILLIKLLQQSYQILFGNVFIFVLFQYLSAQVIGLFSSLNTNVTDRLTKQQPSLTHPS